MALYGWFVGVTLKHESHGLQAVKKLRKQLGGVTFLQGKKVGF